jgi:hypothetical protein
MDVLNNSKEYDRLFSFSVEGNLDQHLTYTQLTTRSKDLRYLYALF